MYGDESFNHFQDVLHTNHVINKKSTEPYCIHLFSRQITNIILIKYRDIGNKYDWLASAVIHLIHIIIFRFHGSKRT